jgi:phage baseplate assembly protein W
LLFDPISDETSQKILFALSDAIQIWEPRIQLILNESFVKAYADANEYEISLVYIILDVDVKSQFDLRISL